MLLDTSGLFCLLHRAEAFHQEACQAYQAAQVWLTHNLILAELVALAGVRSVPRPAVLSFVADLVANQNIETVWVDLALHQKAMDLLSARLDKTYSLCEAVSFVLMREHNLTEALDHRSSF